MPIFLKHSWPTNVKPCVLKFGTKVNLLQLCWEVGVLFLFLLEYQTLKNVARSEWMYCTFSRAVRSCAWRHQKCTKK